MTEIDLRVIKTLENIDYSLLKNLDSLPFQKITVDTLCKCAKINRSTFYKYYTDKYDLLNKYIDRILEEFSKSVKTDFIIGTPSQLEALVYSDNFRHLLILFNKNKSIYQTLWNASIDRQIYTEMTTIIQSNILENINSNFNIDTKKKEYASLFSYLFASEIMIVTNWWLTNDNHISIDDVVKLMDQTTSKGLFMTVKKFIN